MNKDPYSHAHGHNQQPGNEWNDSRHLRAPNSGSVGDAWKPGPAPAVGAGGGGGGIGLLLLLAVGVVVVLPAAAMALLATPIARLLGHLPGRGTSFGWLKTLRTTLVGGMWYLGLTVLLFLAVVAYLAYGLKGAATTFEGLSAWQQWLTGAVWSVAQLSEWVARLWGAGLDQEQYAALFPPVVPSAFLVAGALALQLPGLLAYSIVLQRAGYLGDGVIGIITGIVVASLLVLISLPLAIWLGGRVFAQFTGAN